MPVADHPCLIQVKPIPIAAGNVKLQQIRKEH
jgi:hypothetical protein